MTILLPIPENLSNMLAAEGQMKERMLQEICVDEECQDHLKLLSESVDWIKRIGIHRKHESEDELIVQGLIARMYNDASVAFGLILSGFYQASLMFKRDLHESHLLLEKFALDSSAIQRWKNDSEANEFRASNVRKFLEKNETELRKGSAQSARSSYEAISTLSVHPTYKGILSLLTKGEGTNRVVYWGPMFDMKNAKNSLYVLASATSMCAFSVMNVLLNLKGLDPVLGTQFAEWYIQSIPFWLQKYGVKGNVTE